MKKVHIVSCASTVAQERGRGYGGRSKEQEPTVQGPSREHESTIPELSRELEPTIRGPSRELEPTIRGPSRELEPTIRGPSREHESTIPRLSRELEPTVQWPSEEKESAVQVPPREQEPTVQGPSREQESDNPNFPDPWVVVLVASLVLVALAVAEGEIWEEDDHEVLIRSERGAKNRGEGKEGGNKSRDPCRYVKGAWSDCDSKTNMRTRTLTLKKGDQQTCEQTKTIQKKCKKEQVAREEGATQETRQTGCLARGGGGFVCSQDAASVDQNTDSLPQALLLPASHRESKTQMSTSHSTFPPSHYGQGAKDPVSVFFPAACRYEKGSWSECSSQSQMTRSDSLKPNSDPSCEQSRLITKKCKNKAAKGNPACLVSDCTVIKTHGDMLLQGADATDSSSGTKH
uniref:Pleiotrophin/Midkine C-terminal domain-containing protein n=1 Tax=Timema monikensis TaxID=170555 RepID=A0A7R9E788_9NEOP|nr:unnamed protein product [Timema monikensis]